jgi:hypothetical protein
MDYLIPLPVRDEQESIMVSDWKKPMVLAHGGLPFILEKNPYKTLRQMRHEGFRLSENPHPSPYARASLLFSSLINKPLLFCSTCCS